MEQPILPVFGRAVGAIDGCYMRTMFQSELHDQYITSYDHRYQRVFIKVQFIEQKIFLHEDFFLLGDGGYQLSLTPVVQK